MVIAYIYYHTPVNEDTTNQTMIEILSNIFNIRSIQSYFLIRNSVTLNRNSSKIVR